MKVFVVFALFATVACASSHGEAEASLSAAETESADRAEFLAHATEFVGDFQPSDGAPVEHFAPPPPANLPPGLMAAPSYYGIPSCKLGFKIGLPICIAKCISKGHVGGWCSGSTCKCFFKV